MIRLKGANLQEKFNEYSAYVLRDGYIYDKENANSISKCIQVIETNEVGLMIVGNPGSGKTLFFEMMQKIMNPKSPEMFVKLSVLDVVLQFNNKEIGHGVFRKWHDKNVFFDDLGTEDMGYLYGEKVEVFEKFIQFRYDLFRSRKFKTYFTTNLSPGELNQRYGMRCVSRLNEMCERVVIGGSADYKDRRTYRNFIGLPPVYHDVRTKEDIEWLENYELAKKKAKENPVDYSREGLGSRFKKILGG